MSQIQQLAAAINVSVRQIDEQIAKLGNYQSKLEEMAQRVDSALGNEDSGGREMLNQISMTKQQLDETINQLRVSGEKLRQIRLV